MYIRRKVFSLGEGNIDYDYNLYQALYSDYEDDYEDPIERFYSDSFDEGFDFYAQKMFSFDKNEKVWIETLKNQGLSEREAIAQVVASRRASNSHKNNPIKVGGVDKLQERQEKYGSHTNRKIKGETGSGGQFLKFQGGASKNGVKYNPELIAANLNSAGEIGKLTKELGLSKNQIQKLEDDVNFQAQKRGELLSGNMKLTQENEGLNKRIASLNEDLGSAISERDEARRIGDAYGKKYANERGAHEQTRKAFEESKKAAEEAAKQAKAKQEGLEKSLKRWKVGAGIGAGVAAAGGLGAYLYNRNKDR